MKVLVVAAHPDDEVLGAGGAMASHAAAGDPVTVLILGEGITSRYATRDEAPAGKIEGLRDSCRQAMRILGVKRVEFESFPDNRFDSVGLLDLVKAVEKIKRRVRPEVIYTHSRADLNIDHRLTFQAVLTAARPLKGETVRRILSFEVPSSTEWNFSSKSSFSPSVYMDISRFLDKKVRALKAYGTEIKPAGHPRSLEGIRALARLRGAQSGTAAAEAFQLIREVR